MCMQQVLNKCLLQKQMPVNRGGFKDGSGIRRGGWTLRDRHKTETKVTFLKGNVGYKVIRGESSPNDDDVNSLADNASTRYRR